MTATALHAAQYRLARHYLGKLREAAEAVQRGRASLGYGLRLFDQELSHIQHWQAWAARPGPYTAERARLCTEFAVAGAEALSFRMPPLERLKWLEAALDAARQLHDRQAESAILPKLAMVYSGLGDLSRAEDCARQLLVLAEETKDRLRIGQALYNLGTILEDRGKYDEAAKHYQNALTVFAALGADLDSGRASLGLGSVATYSGDYQSAYHHFLQYLKLVESGGREIDLCIALQAVAEALKYLNRYPEAEAYLQRSEQLSRRLNYQWALGPVLISLGVCAVEQDHLELASGYLEEGIEVARAFSSKRDVIYGLQGLGSVRWRQGKCDEALSYLQEGLAMARETGMSRYGCNLMRRMAEIYITLDDLRSAQTQLREALVLAQEPGWYPEKVKCLSTAVVLGYRRGCEAEAAIWAGRILGDAEIEGAQFMQVCAALESALGAERYRLALDAGKAQTLDGILATALQALT